VVECLELFCVAHKPAKLWDVKDVIREQRGVEVVEKGSIDSGKEYLQIIMSAFEPKFGENGEDKACGRRQRSARGEPN